MSFKDVTFESLRSRTGIKWSYYDESIIPTWVADMDFPVADSIRQAMTEQIERSDFGYPVAPEDVGLPEMFCQRALNHFDWNINSREVLLLTDVVQGLYQSIYTFCSQEEGVIIQTPIYPPFLEAVRELNRKLVMNPLKVDRDKYVIDFDHLKYCVKQKPKVLMFCNPHNPSGRSFTYRELEELAVFACRHDLTVISDEIHADLILDSKPHIPISSIDAEIAKRTVTFMSASKSFNIAGLCLAFAHFGHENLLRSFKCLPSHLTGSLNTLSLTAVKAAWNGGGEWLGKVLEQLRDNRSQLKTQVDRRWPSVKYFPAEATYLAWMDMRDIGPGKRMARFFLENGRVALSEGETFGVEGEGFVRLNFATSPEILSDIIARMDKVIRGS